jgi:hypothetical protein
MVDLKRHRSFVLVMTGLLVMSLTLSSCDSLRRKFIRQRKEPQEQTQAPVLVPEEYATPQTSPEMNYKEHYALIKAWYHDLWTAIDDKNTSRYTHYIITQVTGHIAQMKDLVDLPTRIYLDKLASFLEYYEYSLAYSWQVRNVSRIQSDLRAFDRLLRDRLRIDKVKGHFVKSTK